MATEYSKLVEQSLTRCYNSLGPTPGVHEWLRIRRVRSCALHAPSLTPDETRWSILSLLSMYSQSTIARSIATAFLAGPFERRGMSERAARLFGRRWRWVSALIERVVTHFSNELPPTAAQLSQFIKADRGFCRAYRKQRISIAERIGFRPEMAPASSHAPWPIPSIETAGKLANWLGLGGNELDWFADVRGFERTTRRPKTRHYHYRLLTKRFGRVRVIESPKPCLKSIQRQLLSELVNRIPTHDAAHGFRAGRSILSFAKPHLGRHTVLKMDLQDFFPSITMARVRDVFRVAGYPEEVANLLAGLCTNRTPADIWSDSTCSVNRNERAAQFRYAVPHLPQGAPTSPALANLVAFRLDSRLHRLSKVIGADFTRYADDLVFSGDEAFQRNAKRVSSLIAKIAREEGFDMNHHKTRIMNRSGQQRIAGLVVNERPNLSRREFDRLKAILTNCRRFGPSTQNRAGVTDFRRHLEGRVAFAESINPEKGQKLRRLFDAIDWCQGESA